MVVLVLVVQLDLAVALVLPVVLVIGGSSDSAGSDGYTGSKCLYWF